MIRPSSLPAVFHLPATWAALVMQSANFSVVLGMENFMKIRVIALASVAFVWAGSAHAQINEIEVSDGTSAMCYTPTGQVPCGFFSQPTIDLTVDDGAGNGSEVTTTSTRTTIDTSDSTNSSGLNVQANGTALESNNPTIGYAAIGTQVGTSSASGLITGQVVAQARDLSGGNSDLDLEGQVATIRTVGASGERGFLETTATRTLLGYSADGTALTTGLLSTTTNNTLVGNTDVAGDFVVSGSSNLNGIVNNGAGIADAGLISGVTSGTLSATSTEAVNGAQLFATNTNVATAQTTANTALANAATAQTTADTALVNAAAAQTTADTALTNAAAAQGTANTALTNAATAQVTADTALAGATVAQTTADTALANAATAQGTANTALTTATNAQLSADTANTNASMAVATANTANTNAATALAQTANAVQYDGPAHTVVTLNPGSSAVSLRNVAAGVSPTDAVNMSQLSAVTNNLTAMGNRVTSLESLVENVNGDIRRLDRLAGRGVAIATALASIPPINSDQKIGVGLGFGTYDGRAAFSAAIIGRVDDNTQFRLNAGTTGNGKVAAGGGVTFGW